MDKPIRYSIVIPTWKHLDDLKKCCQSIIEYTNLDNIEVLVVSNGSGNDGTKEYVESLGSPFQLIWIEEQVGYTVSMNIGMKAAKGEFLIPLNNDTILLEQPKNQWIEWLNKPFKDSKMGMTGPMLEHCPEADRDFLIFFCVMIKREAMEDVILPDGNPLDEIFKPAYGEDTDFCCRLVDKGWKIQQVPDAESHEYYAHNRKVGRLPIYHEGNKSYRECPDTGLITRNNEILRQRYNKKFKYDSSIKYDYIGMDKNGEVHPMEIEDKKVATMDNPGLKLLQNEFNENMDKLNNPVDISKAQKCDGYMSDTELEWLANKARYSHVFIEIGSWHGRSTRAIVDNLPNNGVLYAIDHWMGSQSERLTNHASAAEAEGDAAYLEFCDNLFDHIQEGRVIPLRMTSKNAANFLKSKGIQADIIFVDGGHEKPEVIEDIDNWTPLVKDGGILCGHDYYHEGYVWIGVQQAVDEKFGQRGTGMGYLENNSIWAHKINKDVPGIGGTEFKPLSGKPDIYDCFPFNNELDLLELRLNELDSVVDRWVITEAVITHQNKPKPLYFRDNLQRFEKFLHKITSIVVEDFPDRDSWGIERRQREEIMRGLTQCKNNDIIIVTDLDEIPNPEIIKNYKVSDGIKSLEQKLYYYNFNCQANDLWKEAKILPCEILKEKGPCGARYTKCESIPNGGWHFSYIGNTDKIVKKIEDSAHIENNKEEFKSPKYINQCIKEGTDLFGRNLEYKYVEIDENYPKFVLENIEKYKEKGMICQ